MPAREQQKRWERPEMVGLGLLCCTTFLLVCLLTYYPFDYGGLAYPPSSFIHNKGGKVGAILSFALLLHLGLSSYLIPVLTGLWGFLLFVRKHIKFMALKVVTGGLSILASATLLSLFLFSTDSVAYPFANVANSGGFYGLALSHFLTLYFGFFGSFLILGFILFFSLCLATDWLLWDGSYSLILLGKQGAGLLFPRLVSATAFFLSFLFLLMKTLYDHIKIAGKMAFSLLGQVWKKDKPATERKNLHLSGVPTDGTSPSMQTLGKESLKEFPSDESESPSLSGTRDSLMPAPLRSEGEEVLSSAVGFPTGAATLSPIPTAGMAKEKRKKPSLPPLALLENISNETGLAREKVDYKTNITSIEETLRSFGIEARVVNYEVGPVVTTYELELAQGIRVHKVINVADDLAITLKAPNVRIIAPIPNKSTIGLEVPNAYSDVVHLKELLTLHKEYKHLSLPLFLGKNAAGEPIITDLNDMPHLLIAGTTGSGKSVCLNTIISSLLFTRTWEDLKLILIDPKMVELSAYKDISHLACPVVMEMKSVPRILDWLTHEMDERYRLLVEVGVKKIETYNSLSKEEIQKRLSDPGDEDLPEIPYPLPYIVVVIDELADLMFSSSKEVEMAITRLSQKSRAIGIHLIVATQRPSVDVITGLIKSNMPARIAFKVATKVDSRTILDRNGAEKLLGRGDMLLLLPGTFEPVRAQCTYVSDSEIRNLTTSLKESKMPVYESELMEKSASFDGSLDDFNDDLLPQAIQIVVEHQRGSVSLLQRKLGVGYCRASRLIDAMAAQGVVGDYKGSKAREVLVKSSGSEP